METYTPERMREIYEKVKNWGRWGADDQAGALNLITPERRREAARLVQSGESIGCAREFPVHPGPENPHPALHMMVQAGDDCVVEGIGLQTTTDFVGVSYHGMASSHIDALCHVFVDELMYNGRSAAEVKSTGARANDILCGRDGIVGRGVLIDLARARGVDWLEPGEVVGLDEVRRAADAQGVEVREGDILLFVHGRDARRASRGPWSPFTEGLSGLHPEVIPWLHERGIAVLGSDGVSDPLPSTGIDDWPMPVHQCALAAMGVHLLDNLKLDRLAEACARERRWEFLFTVAPLVVAGGTGSPANPVAVL